MPDALEPRRVVVTGIGVLCPAGIGQQAFYDGICHQIPQQPGAIDDFDPAPLFNSPKEMRRHDRFGHLALAAAGEALEQAGDLDCDPARIGVYVGSGMGGISALEVQALVNEKSPRRVSPFVVPMMMVNAGAALVSMHHGFRGPCDTTSTACASGTQSIGRAALAISWGQSDIMLAGGTEAPLSPTAIQGFHNMQAVSAAGISRPFDQARDGFLQAEGAAVLVLEEHDHARKRNATILAEILGYGTNSDAYHVLEPSPGGTGAVTCMELALQDAGLTPGDISHINAHGTSTQLSDAAEADAIHKLFGSSGPPVTSIKGATGHTFGASGAIDAAAVILAMQRQTIPPTANYQTPDPEIGSINLATEPTSWEPGPTLSNSFAIGGHNASLVIGPA